MSTAAPRACAHMGRGSNNTRRMLAAAAALVCTVLVIAAPARAEAVCEEVQGDWRGISAAPMSSQHPRYVHVCRGVKGWRAVPFLWAPLRVSINCSSSSYSVLTAPSLEELKRLALPPGSTGAVPLRPAVWCGFDQMLRDPRRCTIKPSPLTDTYLAVVTPRPSSGALSVATGSGSRTLKCDVHSERELSRAGLVLTVLGVWLFLSARQLSMSSSFRLTSGSFMFMTGMVLLVAMVLMRSMPYKRSLGAFYILSSSTVAAALRWLYGTWRPSLGVLLQSTPFLVYLAVTGLLGLAITYWLDDINNIKLNTTIRVTLQLAGLTMLYFGIADGRVSVCVVVALVGGRWLSGAGRPALLLMLAVVRACAALLAWTAGAGCRAMARLLQLPFSGIQRRLAPTAAVMTAAQRRGSWGIAYRTGAPAVACTGAAAVAAVAAAADNATEGRGDSDDANAGGHAGSGAAAEALLSDEEVERAALCTTRRPVQGGSGGALGYFLGGATAAPRGWAGRWRVGGNVSDSAARSTAAAAAPLHKLPAQPPQPQKEPQLVQQARQVPLDGAALAMSQRLHPQQQQQQQTQQPPAWPAWRSVTPVNPAEQQQQQQLLGSSNWQTGAYRFPSSPPDALEGSLGGAVGAGWATAATAAARPPPSVERSPWGRERLAVDVGRRPPSASPPRSAPAAALPQAAVRASTAKQQQQQDGEDDGPVSPLIALGKILNPDTGRAIAMHKARYNELLAQGYTPDLRAGVLVPPKDGTTAAGTPPTRPSPASATRSRRSAGSTTPH